MTSRINMAAVAARMAAADEEDRKDLEYDAGELRSRDLAIADMSSVYSGDVTSPISPTAGGDASAATPSKAHQRIWNAQRLDAATPSSPAGTRRGGGLTSPNSSITAAASPTTKVSEAKRTMIALRGEVVDALDVLSAQREDIRFRVRNLRDGTQRNNDDCLKVLTLFDEGFVHLDKVGRDVPKVMEEADTELRMAYFNKFGLPVRMPSEQTIQSRMQMAAAKHLTDAENAKLCASIRKEITALLFPIDDKKVPEMLCSANRFTTTDVVADVLAALAKSDSQLASLSAAIAELEAQIAEKIRVEDYVEAERLTNKMLELSGKRTDLKALQVTMLAGTAEDEADGSASTMNSTSSNQPKKASAAGFIRALDELLYSAAIPSLKDEKDRLIATSRSDIGKLTSHHGHVLKANDLAVARYNKRTSEAREAIRANHAKQFAIWEQVSGLMDEMEVVGQEHERMVNEQVKHTEVEQLRRQDHREYLDSYKRHMVTLEDIIRNAEMGLGFLDAVNARFVSARAEVLASGMEDKLQDILTDQRKAYLEAYRHFGINMNRTIARHDQRIANCEHMASELNFARSQAATVGDTDKNIYTKRGTDIDRQRLAATDKVASLSSEFQHREDTFVDITVRVQLSQRAKAEKREQLGMLAVVDANKDGIDDNSGEGELLAELRGARASALQAHYDKISAVVEHNSSSVAALRSLKGEVEMVAQRYEAEHTSRARSRAGISETSAFGNANMSGVANAPLETNGRVGEGSAPQPATPQPLSGPESEPTAPQAISEAEARRQAALATTDDDYR